MAASATHLELLVGQSLDLVIVSSPLSVYPPMRVLLRREMRLLSRTAPVVAIEPTAEAAAAMGYDMMDTRRAPRVTRIAYETTLRVVEHEHLRERFGVAF
jgi:hypothetical protein